MLDPFVNVYNLYFQLFVGASFDVQLLFHLAGLHILKTGEFVEFLLLQKSLVPVG